MRNATCDNPTLEPTVYVVEDDDLVREMLAATLTAAGHRTRVFVSAEDFLAQFRHCPAEPRCLVTDVRMPGLDGISLRQTLAERQVRMPTVFITAYAQVDMAVTAMKTGAADFLEKPFARDALLTSVRQALSRDSEACAKLSQRRRLEGRLATLTPRERDVYNLLVQAKSSKEVAAALSLSVKTVFIHRANVLHKMEVDSVVELMRQVEDCRD